VTLKIDYYYIKIVIGENYGQLYMIKFKGLFLFLSWREGYNNNNNNLFLRSHPSYHTKLVYETPLFVGQGTPLRPAIWLVKSTKVYISNISNLLSYY